MSALAFRFVLVLAAVAAGAFAAAPVEMARIEFAAGGDDFELSAASDGMQVLTVATATADVRWISPEVSQKHAAGRLSFRLPVAAGESIIAGKPQAMPGGGILFVFSKVSAPAALAPALIAAPLTPAPAPLANVGPAPKAPVPSTPPPTAIAPAASAMIAPAASVVSPPLLAPVNPSAPANAPEAKPSLSALLAEAGVVRMADSREFKTLATQLLPAPEKLDPLPKADFSIPETPGAAVLDQTAQVLRPAAPRETMTSLLSNFDSRGALKTGFALAITPYSMLRPTPVTLREYNESDWARFFTNLQVSLAAKTGPAPAAGATAPALFGVGLSAVVFDRSDPRTDRSLIQNLRALFPTAWGTQEDSEAIARGEMRTVDVPVDARRIAAHRSMVQAARNARWNAPALGLGYALRLESTSGRIDQAKADGGGAWVNFSRPGFGSLEPNSQFLFTASYRYRDAFTRDGLRGLEDTLNAAAQYRVGTRDFNGFAQAVHHWRTPRGLPRTADLTLEIGLERKVLDGLWFNVSWTNDKSLGGSSAMKTGLRYGFGEAATLGETK